MIFDGHLSARALRLFHLPIDLAAHGHFWYEVGRFESLQDCSRLLLQNNAHST